MNSKFNLKLLLKLSFFISLKNSSCLDQSLSLDSNLTFFKTPNTPINESVCTNIFQNYGACLSSNDTQNFFNSNFASLLTSASNSFLLSLQFVNATFFWDNISTNGSLNNYSSPKLGSWFYMAQNLFKTPLNNKIAYFLEKDQWIINIYTDHIKAINPCFEAWGNITIGGFCMFASGKGPSSNPSIIGNAGNVGLSANKTDVGKNLRVCLPLINTYCAVNFGLLITNTTPPFIQSSFLEDGGITYDNCLMLQNINGCKTGQCIQQIDSFLSDMYFSNSAAFSPGSNYLNATGTVFSGSSNLTDFVKNGRQSNKKGFSFYDGGLQTGLDYYSLGIYLNTISPQIYYSMEHLLFCFKWTILVILGINGISF